MDRRILAIVLMVAITSGLCIATENIFNNKYENKYTNQEREASFREDATEGDLDPVIVAHWLAKSADKESQVSNSGVTINGLLRLAEFDRQSAKDCTRDRAEEYSRICKAVRRGDLRHTYDYYADYCNYCFEKLYEHCNGLGHSKEFEGLGPAIFSGPGDEKNNVFGVEYEEENGFDNLLADLDEDELDPKGVAELLAQSDNKWLELAPDVSIKTLLRLAEIDRSSDRDCNRQRVDKSREICEQLKDAKYAIGLIEYCHYCNEKLFEHCSAKGHYELFKGSGRAIFNEPGNPKENIFGVVYEDIDSFERVLDKFSSNEPEDMDFKEIAQAIAKSTDKSSEIAPGVSMSLMLRLAEFDRHSKRDCYRERVDKSKKICKTVEANKFRTRLNFPGYCNYCVDQLVQHCTSMGVTDLV